MKKTGTSVDIRTIKNFPSDNPNAKIVKDGLFLRVVEREYYWSKEKQRGLERRRYLGYIIDDVYYDTETYKKYFKRTGARRLVPLTASNPQNGTVFLSKRYGLRRSHLLAPLHRLSWLHLTSGGGISQWRP